MVAGWKKRDPLIFLDYEGVIMVPGGSGVPVASAVQALNTLLGQTGGKVVLITPWRLNKTKDFMQGELREWGVTKAEVVGMLPYIYEGKDQGTRCARAIAVWFMLVGRLPVSTQVFALITPHYIPGPVGEKRLVQPIGVMFSGQDVAAVKQCLTTQVETLEKAEQAEREAAL